MRRVVSGRDIYGPKRSRNKDMEDSNSSSDNESGDAIPVIEIGGFIKSEVAAPPPPLIETNDVADDDTQTSIDIRRRAYRISDRHETMYRASVEGDWIAAEMLLEVDPKLCTDEISSEGDRALHVAASMNHKDFVQKLVERMIPSELQRLDGRGYTACCYVAISGCVEIADIMIRKNPTLATTRDREYKTPLHKAALRGNSKMVSYLLKSTKVEDLSKDEWFDVLLATISREMYIAALTILESHEQLATMRNDEGTALHLLATQPFFVNGKMISGIVRREMRLLAKKLLEGIEKLGQANAIAEMKSPPILLIAAEEGNVELITMLTHAYPHLVWQTNNRGYTIFHIAANYRHYHLFGLINEIGARKDFIAISQDEHGNNILHLAAELEPPGRRWILGMAAFQMQREVVWFEKVRAIVPPLCIEMRNKEGYTPRELFAKRHKSLLEESRTWIRNTADSCMLISTLIFSVVFASTFAVPGGYDQNTGIPLLYKTNWFMCFVIFEALAMFSSALCIVCFLRIMMLGYGVSSFVSHLPNWLVWGLNSFTFSVFSAITAFMSAYFMIYANDRPALVDTLIVSLYLVIVFVVCIQIHVLRIYLPKRFLRSHTRHTLFKRPHAAVAPIRNKRRRLMDFLNF